MAWDFAYGEEFTEAVQEKIFEALSPSHITGLSLLGGEPFEPQNQRALLPFLREVKRRFPAKDIWCWTGYIYEKDLLPGGRAHCEVTNEMLSLINTLVDGPFIEAQKDISLKFRGSANQRILNLHNGIATLSPLNK